MYTCQLYRRWIRQPPQPFCSHEKESVKKCNETKITCVKTCAISASLPCPWCRGSCAAAGWCCSPISPTKTSHESNKHQVISSAINRRRAILNLPTTGKPKPIYPILFFQLVLLGKLRVIAKGVGTKGWAQKNRLSVNRCNSRMMTHKQAYELLLL